MLPLCTQVALLTATGWPTQKFIKLNLETASITCMLCGVAVNMWIVLSTGTAGG